MKTRIFCGLVIILFGQVGAQQKESVPAETELFTQNVFYLSEVMLHDVANPPAASRFYAYSILGAHAIINATSTRKNVGNELISKLDLQYPTVPKETDPAFCAIYAMLEVGKNIMPSGYLLDVKQKELVSHFKDKVGLSDKNLQKQMRFATEVAKQIVTYARTDGYSKLSTYRRYVTAKEEGFWFPTPPEYMAAVEPQWKTVRPFFIDSASQFAPAPPVAYSTDPESPFYKQLKEVYTITQNLTEEQKQIANFWDCNPFAVTYSGHMAIGLKKISPGGHWIGITGIASNQAKLPLDSAIYIHAVVAMTLHDSFISCWNEKYSSNRIRPVTAITKLLDPQWKPLLQTPPFPEYTSGHSVVSSAMSVVLTHFFGEHFSFVDTSEEYFGLPARKFNSFSEAAQEAAISRLYGGIHFRDACENGVLQGSNLANFILQKKLILINGK